jgi:hypothetical protein
MDILIKIKRLVLSRNVIFTRKAQSEIEHDHLSVDLVYEAILNAPGIKKKIRSSNPDSGTKERRNFMSSSHRKNQFQSNEFKIECFNCGALAMVKQKGKRGIHLNTLIDSIGHLPGENQIYRTRFGRIGTDHNRKPV